MAQLPDIESKFCLGSGSYEDLEIIGSSGPAAEALVARLAKWPPFRMRNIAVSFEGALSDADGPEVWLNASVTEFAFDPAGNLSGATSAVPRRQRIANRGARRRCGSRRNRKHAAAPYRGPAMR